MSNNDTIRKTARIAAGTAAVLSFIVSPYQGKGFALVLAGTAACAAWFLSIGFAAALQELADQKKAAEIARRERKLNVIEITKKGRNTTWRQAR